MPLPSPNPTKLPSRLRLLVLLVVAAVLLPALARLWCIKGLIQTIRIDGPSMAETLCGDHFRVTVTLPSHAALPRWLRPLQLAAANQPITATAERHLPSRHLPAIGSP